MCHRPLGELFVVGFDLFQIVEVVDHQAEGLFRALGRQVAERIQPFESGAVVEVEPRDRVAAGRCGTESEVVAAQAKQRL